MTNNSVCSCLRPQIDIRNVPSESSWYIKFVPQFSYCGILPISITGKKKKKKLIGTVNLTASNTGPISGRCTDPESRAKFPRDLKTPAKDRPIVRPPDAAISSAKSTAYKKKKKDLVFS